MTIEKSDTNQPKDQEQSLQKLDKKDLAGVSGGSYEPDTTPKDDDILLPEIPVDPS